MPLRAISSMSVTCQAPKLGKMRSPSLVFSGEQSKGRFALGMLNVYEGPIAPKTRHFILFSDLTVLKKSQKNLRSHFLMKIFMQ